jgi:hypothetical protein
MTDSSYSVGAAFRTMVQIPWIPPTVITDIMPAFEAFHLNIADRMLFASHHAAVTLGFLVSMNVSAIIAPDLNFSNFLSTHFRFLLSSLFKFFFLYYILYNKKVKVLLESPRFVK